jgi:hypothetical protein
MNNIECHFGFYTTVEDKVPVPENLKSKDMRADPVAKAAVFSANDVIKNSNIENTSELNVIVVNREGCTAHVKKISDGLSKRAARQGFFARGGPQTLATYTALALNSHGAAYTLVGEESAVDIALNSALYLSEAQGSGVILTVVTKRKEAGFKAISVLIKSVKGNAAPRQFEDIYNKLITVYQPEYEA